SRGKIDVFITQDKFKQEDIVINVDEQLAEAYYTAFESLKKKFNLKDEVSLMLLSKFQDIVTVEKKEEDLDATLNILLKAVDEAIKNLIDMRQVEGKRLESDILLRCDLISNYVEEIESRADSVVDEYREKIKQRVTEYLAEVELDEARLLNEVAFFADKSNITEEIVRLKSHLAQMKSTIILNEPVGKKLDFLVQEMNRETNTIGSKANDLSITNMVVNIKSEIEKIREQIQNIE
ncbi:MAG TPA: YicC family protein, partial [Clostridiaceae bacterium]|nr:YicC family protein [Clostridiaceae bacterium]